MSYMRMLRLLKILQDSTACNNTVHHIVNTEPLQVLHLEMLQQLLSRRLFRENPVVKFKGKNLVSEIAFKLALLSSLVEHLFRLYVAKQFFHIVRCSLASYELSCRDIQKGHSKHALTEMYCCKEVVLLVVKHIIAHCHTWCYQLRNTTLYEFFCKFRIFQLVANCYTLSSTYQFRQVSV